MEATIITIGDEILYGKTVDTNSAWLGRELNQIGVRVAEIISIADTREHILDAMTRAKLQSRLIIITGGLGPTRDDVTKATIAEFFGVEQVLNEEIFERIKAYFSKRGPKYVEMNKKLAYLPSNCSILSNDKGTAAGMWFQEEGRIYISLPGVPHEMVSIMEKEGIPRIQQSADLPFIHHRHIMTAGVGESVLAEKLNGFEDALPENVKLAYLPNLGMVKLRLSGNGKDKEQTIEVVDRLTEEASGILSKYVYGYDELGLEEALGKLLMERNATMGTAESCTGGNIAHRITLVPGSSRYFKGSVVSYANEVKSDALGVPERLIEEHGAVSQEVVEAMATGLIGALEVDYAIALSGVAGPGGGTAEKPVGTVWVAVGDRKEVISRCYQLKTSRSENIEISSTLALNLLRRFLIGQLEKH